MKSDRQMRNERAAHEAQLKRVEELKRVAQWALRNPPSRAYKAMPRRSWFESLLSSLGLA